jgi:hypothetical protein
MMSYMAWMLLAAFVVIPVWRYLVSTTDQRLKRWGNIDVPTVKRRKGLPPPDNRLPPLIGGIVERKIARKL